MLLGADAVGKHLLIRFDDGRTLHAHLLMTGSWRVGPAATEPEWHRRIELWLDDGRLTGLDVPLLSMIATRDEADVVGHLGPDLCAVEAPDLDLVDGQPPARHRTSRSAARCSISATSPAGATCTPTSCRSSSASRRSSRSGRSTGSTGWSRVGAALIRTNAARGPQNTTGRKLTTDDHWIYQRRSQPCPLCATRLASRAERDVPWRRVTTWCPVCQPQRAEVTVDLPRARRLLALHPARREPAFPAGPRTLSGAHVHCSSFFGTFVGSTR